MKQFKITILFTMLMSMVSINGFADYDAEIDGIFYRFTNKEAIVTCQYTTRENRNAYWGNIVIPESVTYHDKIFPVTEIDKSAFFSCTDMITVVIGNNVKIIGDKAFKECGSLTSITMGNNVTKIGSSAFKECIDLSSITIPNSVTAIGNYAFSRCIGLTSVTIPNSVTSIGDGTFYDCSSLTSVTIPNSVTTIGVDAFWECSGLTSVHISDLEAWCGIEFRSNPLSKAHHLYLNGEEIKNLVIPNSVTSIGSSAFSGCSGLISVTIPNSVTSIGGGAFYGCSGLTSVTIGNSVTSIGSHAFYGCSGLASVTIPNSVTSIGDGAFSNCSGLTSVTIPNSVTSIGGGAFYGCSGLTSVTIPNSVTTIGNDAFNECSGLTSVTIPNSVTSIGDGAFDGCSGLTSVTIGNSVTSIGGSAFRSCSGLTSVTIPNSVTSIGDHAFGYCKKLTDVTCLAKNLSHSLSSNNGLYTYDTAFYGSDIEYATLHVPAAAIEAYKATAPWSGFKSIVSIGEDDPSLTPDGETNGACGESVNYYYDKNTKTLSISGKGELYDYDNGSNKAPWSAYADEIQKIEIEPGIISVGYFAFYKCSSLTSLSVPATLKYIGSSAFEDCTSLSSLSLDEGLLIIEGSAFKNCKGITDVYCNAKRVPKTDKTAFDGTPIESATLHVPANSVDAYRKSGPWSGFKEIVSLESTPIIDDTSVMDNGIIYSVKGDGTLEVKGIENETTMVDIPSSITINGNDYRVTSIGEAAFHKNSTIESVKLPHSITSIGEIAFGACSNLKSINIPEKVTFIGDGAFYGCSSLTYLYLPDGFDDGIKRIGNNMFWGCVELTAMNIPPTVTSIGEEAFRECQKLDFIRILGNVVEIGKNAFQKCNKLTQVNCFAESVPNTDKTAFDGTPIESATLHVPANSVEAYKASQPWSGFKEIAALTNWDYGGIEGVKLSEDSNGVYYDLTGRKVSHPQKGIYIKNGKKVILK